MRVRSGSSRGFGLLLCGAIAASGCERREAAPEENPPQTAPVAAGAPTAALPEFEPSPPEGAELLESGIWVDRRRAGEGTESPTASRVATYHILSWDSQGRPNTHSRAQGAPFSHPVGRAVRGLRLALEQMVVGERSRFWVPQPLMDYSEPTDPPQYYVADIELLGVRPLNEELTLAPQQQKLVRLFNLLHARNHLRAINITWMGVEIQQNPSDLWMWQELIWELKPDFIIETGTYTGGSSFYLASLLEVMDLPGKVITVDINPIVEEVSKHPIFQKRVTVVTGDSAAPETVQKVADLVAGAKVVMVTLDSLHTRDHVLKELERYGPLVTPGSYVIVQDTRIQDFMPQFGPGPGEAVEEFLKTHDEFEIDRERERLLLTYYAGGFLRKTR